MRTLVDSHGKLIQRKTQAEFCVYHGGAKMDCVIMVLGAQNCPTFTEQKWVWGKAKIDGNNVVISSDQVANPVAVRYAWASNLLGNLYNKEGLPASTFRTDDWTDPTPVAPLKLAIPAPIPKQ